MPAPGRRLVHARWAVALAERAGDPVALARSLTVLSRVLRHAGQAAEAVTTAERAAALAEPRIRPPALVQLGYALQGDRPADALDAARRAVEGYRALAPRSRRVRTDLGLALVLFGECLVGQGQAEEAVAALREGRGYLDGLTPGRMTRAVYARLQSGAPLARALIATGRAEEAVTVARQACELAAIPARLQPSYGRSARATALAWLAAAQLSTKDFEAGRDTVREAVVALRAVGGREAEVAWLLATFANAAAKAKRADEAVQAHTEAAPIYRRLAEQGVISREEHASVIANQFELLYLLGRKAEAVEVALAIAPDLQHYPPNDHLRHVLRNAGAQLANLGRVDEALLLTDGAVRQSRALGKRKEWASAALAYARILEKAGRSDDALDAVDDFIGDYHRRAGLADTWAALALGYRASLLVARGRLDEAEASAREGLSVARTIENYEGLVVALSQLADICSRQHQHEEAATLAAEAAELRRPMAAKDPKQAIHLLRDLRRRVGDLVAIGQAAQTRDAIDEVLELSRRLAEHDAPQGIDELAFSLRAAARAHAADDRLAEAIAALRELRRLADDHPTPRRRQTADDAFSVAYEQARQTLPGAWLIVTGEPFPTRRS